MQSGDAEVFAPNDARGDSARESRGVSVDGRSDDQVTDTQGVTAPRGKSDDRRAAGRQGKERKRSKKYVRLSPQKWNDLRDDYILGHLTAKELAAKYGVAEGTIRNKAYKQNWPTLNKLRKKAEELGIYQPDGSISEQKLQELAVDWALAPQKHRELMARVTKEKLTRAAEVIKPPKDWREMEIADRIARRNLGLEDGPQDKPLININLREDSVIDLNRPQDSRSPAKEIEIETDPSPSRSPEVEPSGSHDPETSSGDES